MKKQFYYSVHANKDQVQEQETDSELYELLSHLQVSKINRLLDDMSKSFMSLGGNRTRLFYGFKYNDYTNLSKLEAGRRIYVHGMKGVHDLKRSTAYFDFFVSEDSTLAGSGFFNYVFGTDYPTEYELRTKDADQIKQLLNEAAESPEERQTAISISNKDRMLVCKIAERLWTSQLNDSTSRLVILLPSEEIYEESVSLLKQLYLLLPQRLRLNMGFAVDCSMEDIKNLTETCDLPVHIFTMKKADKSDLEAIRTELNLKYPIVYFDATSSETEAYDEKKLDLLVKLSKKLSSSRDAKMTYIEKKVLEDGNRLVSFKHLEEIFEKMQNDDFFWWDRNDLETPESVMAAYVDQKDLMEEGELKKEALYSFYTKMLPWKDYAFCLNEIILDSQYPNRDEILAFFADELCYGKILEASVKIQQKLQKQAEEHEMAAVEEQKLECENQVNAIRTECRAEVQQEQEKRKAAEENSLKLEQRNWRIQDSCQRQVEEEKAKGEKNVQKVKNEEKARYDSLNRKYNDLKLEKEKADRENDQNKSECKKLKTENESLSKKVKELIGGSAGREIERLKDEAKENEKEMDDLRKKNTQVNGRVKKAKLCMVIAAAVAAVFLISTVVLGVFVANGASKRKALGEELKQKEQEITELNDKINLQEETDQLDNSENLTIQAEEATEADQNDEKQVTDGSQTTDEKQMTNGTQTTDEKQVTNGTQATDEKQVTNETKATSGTQAQTQSEDKTSVESEKQTKTGQNEDSAQETSTKTSR